MTVSEFLNKFLCLEQLQTYYASIGPVFQCVVWSLASLLGITTYYGWREGPSYSKQNRIDGKVVIVTGCSSGIGKETALELAKRGARVYMACKDFDKCEKARREIMSLSDNYNVFNYPLDLSSLQSVQDFAEKFKSNEMRLDILINNADLMATTRNLTMDGHEEQFAVNHLGPFLLTDLLLDKLKASAPSRIVVISSRAYIFGKIQKADLNSEKDYGAIKAYCQSKLANILFTQQLAKRLSGIRVTVNCLHPGFVQRESYHYDHTWLKWLHFFKFLFRSVKAGAQTVLYLALDPELEEESGGYYDRMTLTSVKEKAKDEEMANWLWTQSEKMVGLITAD